LRKIETFQNDIMRACLTKRRIDKMPINELLQRTNLTPNPPNYFYNQTKKTLVVR